MRSTPTKKQVAQDAYATAVQRDYRHNASMFVGADVLWGLGVNFSSTFTMVPAYLAAIFAPKALIGVVTSLALIFFPLQLLTGHLLRGKTKRTWVALSYLGSVIPWLIYSVVYWFYPNAWGQRVHLGLFTLCVGIVLAVASANEAVRFSLITECMPVKRRGRLFGYRAGAVAAGALISYLPARWLMQRWSEPQNYVLAFAIGTVFWILFTIPYLFVREHQNPIGANRRIHGRRASSLSFIIRATARKMWRCVNYRKFLLVLLTFTIAMLLGPFLIVYAKQHLEMSGSQVVLLTLVSSVPSAVLMLLLGQLADHIGYRWMGLFKGALLALAFILALVVASTTTKSITLLYVSFFLYMAANNVWRMVLLNYSVELMPRLNVAMLVAVAQLFLFPATLFVAPCAGWFIDCTGLFYPVFWFGLGLSLISAFAYMVWVPETRILECTQHDKGRLAS